MGHLLDGIKIKLVRAEEHLNEVGKLLGPMRYGEFQVISKYNPDDGMVHLIADFPKPDLRPSAIIGECVYNMRSALDHLVWQLVIVNGETPTERTMFPICNTLPGFNDRVKRGRLQGVSNRAMTLIQGLQPFQRGQPSCDLHPLWILDKLTNIDKHRSLALTITLATSYEIYFPMMTIRVSGPDGGPSYSALDGAEFYAFRPDLAFDTRSLEKMQMNCHGTFFVAFKDAPVAKGEVISTLQSILDFIRQDLIPAFEPFFN